MAQQPKQLLKKQNTIYLPELFEQIENAPDRETRKFMLVEYYNKDEKHKEVLKAFTELMWHPMVEFVLPDGTPPFAEASKWESEAPNSLFKVFRQIGRFLKGSRIFIANNLKREQHFITILESLSERESKILIAIKDKEFDKLYPKVTCDLFCEVFGGVKWLPEEVLIANPPILEETKSKK